MRQKSSNTSLHNARSTNNRPISTINPLRCGYSIRLSVRNYEPLYIPSQKFYDIEIFRTNAGYDMHILTRFHDDRPINRRVIRWTLKPYAVWLKPRLLTWNHCAWSTDIVRCSVETTRLLGRNLYVWSVETQYTAHVKAFGQLRPFACLIEHTLFNQLA